MFPEEVVGEGPVDRPDIVAANDPVPVGPTPEVPFEVGYGAELPEIGSALEIAVPEFETVSEVPVSVPVGAGVIVPLETG